MPRLSIRRSTCHRHRVRVRLCARGCRRQALGVLVLAVGGAVLLPAAAQQQESAGGGRGLTITPTFTATQTVTDIRRKGAGRDGVESVTQLSPGFVVSSRSGRLRGSLAYAANVLVRRGNGQSDDLENSLAAAFNAEVVEGVGFVDVQANVSQRNVSAFGEQLAADSLRDSDNRTEVRSYVVSPYLRGSLAGLAGYELRHTVAGTDSQGENNPDSTTGTTAFTLSSLSGGAVFGWNVQLQRQTLDFGNARSTRTDRANLGLTATPLPDLQLSVSGGRERTDIVGATQRSYSNWGAGLRWTPSPRTNVSLQQERRYFGDSHTVLVEHRLQRSVFRFSDIRGVNGGADPNGVGQPVSLYELFFFLYASIQPDPVLRQQLVLLELQRRNLNPNETVRGGTLNAAVSRQRRQDLSFALQGVRSSVTLQAWRSNSEDPGALLEQPAAPQIFGGARQSGLTATLSHRLTPESSANLSASLQKTHAAGSVPGNDLRSLALTWQARLSRRTSGTLGARYSQSDGGSDPYDEAALSASLSLQF